MYRAARGVAVHGHPTHVPKDLPKHEPANGKELLLLPETWIHGGEGKMNFWNSESHESSLSNGRVVTARRLRRLTLQEWST